MLHENGDDDIDEDKLGHEDEDDEEDGSDDAADAAVVDAVFRCIAVISQRVLRRKHDDVNVVINTLYNTQQAVQKCNVIILQTVGFCCDQNVDCLGFIFCKRKFNF